MKEIIFLAFVLLSCTVEAEMFSKHQISDNKFLNYPWEIIYGLDNRLWITECKGKSTTFRIATDKSGTTSEPSETNITALEDSGSVLGFDYLDAEAPETEVVPVIDGKLDEIWADAPSYTIDHLWVDSVSKNENTKPAKADFSGSYKLMWKGSTIYIFAEITDDVLDSISFSSVGNPSDFFKHDTLEILIDEDNSGGAHTKTHNAFVYHLSPNGYVVDQCGCGSANDYSGNSGDWWGRYFNENLDYFVKDLGNNKYRWEIALRVYDDTYNDNAKDNASALVGLTLGKTLGFGIAYNDYDKSPTDGRHLMGSFFVPGNNNGTYDVDGGRNILWQDASAFADLILAGTKIPK